MCTQVVVVVSSVAHLKAALALPEVQLVSITQRNLATWATDSDRAARLLAECASEVKSAVDSGVLLLVEGGISDRKQLKALQKAGVRAAIVGEALLREDDVKAAVQALLAE
jgi:indole-3-glycerol phosphate synthase